MSIYLARHGQTDWNLEFRIQGQSDIPLNRTGEMQAAELYANLVKEGAEIAKIYSSTLSRAYKTASIVGEKYGVPVIKIPGLEEVDFGLFEGHTWDEVYAEYTRIHSDWSLDKFRRKDHGGESYVDMLKRFLTAFEQIKEESEDILGAGRDILIVTHFSSIMSLLTIREGLDFRDSYKYVGPGNAEPVKFEIDELDFLLSKGLSQGEESV